MPPVAFPLAVFFTGVRGVVRVVAVLDVEGACFGDLGIHLAPTSLDRHQPAVAQST